MKLESLNNEKFRSVEKSQLKNVRGLGVLITTTSTNGGTFDVIFRGTVYNGVTKDEKWENGQGLITRMRIQFGDGSWQELQV